MPLSQKARQVSVEKAAEIMGVTPVFLRLALRQGRFPFGVAVEMGKTWRYYINEIRFREWLSGSLQETYISKTTEWPVKEVM